MAEPFGELLPAQGPQGPALLPVSRSWECWAGGMGNQRR